MMAADWNPEALPPAPADAPAELSALRAELEAAGAVDRETARELRVVSEEERERAILGATVTRANLAEATRPLTSDELAELLIIDPTAWRAYLEAEKARRGLPTLADTLNAVDPLGDRQLADVTTAPSAFPEPEDRGTATLSTLGHVEYVEDLIRPGRIIVVAAEEGAGKSYAIGGELAIRVAVAGGSFAGTWPVLRTGPVLYLSEMHADDDYGREATVLSSLGLERPTLAGRYYRLPLMTAAGGRPALTVPEWRTFVTAWLSDHGALLLIIDTATGATQIDPWGREIQAVYAALRVMLAEYPDLAIVLLIHLKKPQGRGERRISDVLGEWGRWCDVVILMENDGNALTRARLTVRKRVRHERRIVVTKAGGLLIDPQDLDDVKATKVPLEAVLAAIVAAPGITYAELGAAIGVSRDTASRYARALGAQAQAVKGTARGGTGAKWRLYAVSATPHDSAEEGCGDGAAINAAEEAPQRAEPPQLRTTCIGAETLRAETPAVSPAEESDPDILRMALDVWGDDLVRPETVS